MEVSVDKFGRIVIPKAVRDEVGLEAGTKLHVETRDTGRGVREIALRPEREQPLFVRKGKVLVFSGQIGGEGEKVDAAESVRRARQQRADRLTNSDE